MDEEIIQQHDEELALLKERADLLGIKYSKNVTLETLKAKVNAKLEEAEVKAESKVTLKELRDQKTAEETKLIRIRLAVMNPNKKNWRGEVITIANPVIGTVKKFVPFDASFYENGYHVPNCIYKALKNRKFLNIITDPKTHALKGTQYVPEFSIEVLPALTPLELKRLAQDQRAGNRID